jgi:hypothetical protein
VEDLVPHRREGVELQVSVIGRVQAVQAALAGLRDARVESADGQQHLIQWYARDQAEVDRCIDALRKQSLSIVSLGRRRVSLEEAFMEVLGLNTGKP